MRLRVLGSSDAFNSAGRCHASYLLEGGGSAPVAVDFGATGLFALHQQGLSAKDIAAVLVTHLHGDHFGGLGGGDEVVGVGLGGVDEVGLAERPC